MSRVARIAFQESQRAALLRVVQNFLCQLQKRLSDDCFSAIEDGQQFG